MSDKFLQTGGGNVNLSNGTINLFAGILGANNLKSSKPIKTNSLKQLVSEKLDIADINDLQSDLNTKNSLDFVKSDTHNNPPAGEVKIYAKTDGELYKKDENGVETGLGGGGGGLDYTVGSTIVENGMIFTDGVSNTDVKNVAGFRLDTINNTLVVNDVETVNQLSIDQTLTNISYNPVTQRTMIDGVVEVDAELYASGIATYEVGGLTNDITIIFDEANGIIEIKAPTTRTDQTVFNNDKDVVSKKYVDDLLSSIPIVKRLRITKTPGRAPTAGNAVYEDEFIRLGWDQATASDLEIQRTPASPAYLSFCFRTATISEQEVFVSNADTTYTLNNFGFNGGEIMECRLTPFESSTAPAYHISIHFTESSTGTDGDLDWIITRYNI